MPFLKQFTSLYNMNKIIKSMRNIFTIIFLALSFVAYGCSDNAKAKDNSVKEETLKSSEETIYKLQDDLAKIKKDLDKQRSIVNEHQKFIQELTEDKIPNYLIWGVIICAVAIVVVVIFYEKKCIKSKLDRHSSDIDELSLKIKEYKDGVNAIKKNMNLYSQLNHKESKVQDENSTLVEENPHTPVMEVKTEITPVHTEKMLTGYFGMLIGDKYFNEFMTSTNDNALFRAYINDTEGDFEVFSLDAIRSIDGIENAVCKEGVSIKDAKHFDVIQKGKVKKNSKGKWDVIAPTRIKLS